VITDTIKRNTESLLEASREVHLEVNMGKLYSCLHQNAGKNHNLMTANKFFENLVTAVANQNSIHKEI
jgi:hypothetical protein